MSVTKYPVRPVLGHGSLQVRDVLGTDLSVINAARVSYGKYHEVLEPRDERLLRYLIKNHHFSPFRHCMVSFHVKCPIFVQRQFWKHLIGCEYTFKDTGYNEISGRYIELKQCYEPSTFRKQAKVNKQGSEGEIEKEKETEVVGIWRKMVTESIKAYEKLLELGVCKEQARGILPLNVYTEFIWTASFQAIMNFIELRSEKHAQYEIRKYAEEMKEDMTRLYPLSVKCWLEPKD